MTWHSYLHVHYNRVIYTQNKTELLNYIIYSHVCHHVLIKLNVTLTFCSAPAPATPAPTTPVPTTPAPTTPHQNGEKFNGIYALYKVL